MRALGAGLLLTAAIPGSYFQPLAVCGPHPPTQWQLTPITHCFLTPNKDGVSKRTSVLISIEWSLAFCIFLVRAEGKASELHAPCLFFCVCTSFIVAGSHCFCLPYRLEISECTLAWAPLLRSTGHTSNTFSRL